MKLVKTIVVLFLFSITSGEILFAQELNARDSTRRIEVGTDLLWLIGKNTSAPSIFVRYFLGGSEERKMTQALRFRLGFSYNQYDSTFINGIYPGKKTSINPELRIGYEWMAPLSRKGRAIYGIDFKVHYQYKKFEVVSIGQAPDYENVDKIKNFEFGPVIFLGYKYLISSDFSVSIESSLSFTRRNSTFWGRTYPLNDPSDIWRLRDDSYSNSRIQLLPLAFLNLLYTIKTQHE